MKNKAWQFVKKNYLIITLILIILAGGGLRLYHFSDWLHFELDQSRDAKVIDLALAEGPDNLPLQGPKAAGSFLRLGPIFYYFQYLSALVFGGTPSGMAMITALFGIGAIPLFYFLGRRYFEAKISLTLTFLFSLSLFLIMYSRFSWNPNALPFFILLAFLAMLRSVDVEEKRRGWWLVVFFVALTVATQLHFLAFVTLPIIAFFFFLVRLPKASWYFWIGGILAALLLYLPLVLNDVKTGGDNFRQFLKVAESRSTDNGHSIASKLVKNYNEQALGFWLILTGKNEAELPRIILWEGENLKIICDQDCRDRLTQGKIAWLFFSAGILMLLINFFRLRRVEGQGKDFLLLVFLWLAVMAAFYTPIAYDISPRFLLPLAPLPFIFLGFFIELGKRYLPSKWKYLVLVLIIIPLFMNLRETKKRFAELEKAPVEAANIGPDKILKEKIRVTLKQQNMILDQVENFYRQNNFPVYLNSDPQYRRSLLYLLDRRLIPREDWRNITSDNKVYRNGNYFLVFPTLSNIEKDLKKYKGEYDVLEEYDFGSLILIRLEPKEEAINRVQQDIQPRGKTQSAQGVPVRYSWEEIFNENSEEEN